MVNRRTFQWLSRSIFSLTLIGMVGVGLGWNEAIAATAALGVGCGMALLISLFMFMNVRVLGDPDNLFANPRRLFGFYLGFALTNLIWVI